MNLVENSVWNLDINGKPALNALGELEAKLTEVKEKQDDLKRGTKEWADGRAEIKKLEEEVKRVRETMGTAGMTVNQLKDYAKQLNKEILGLTPGTDAYIKKTEDLKDVNTRLAAVRDETRAVKNEVDNTKSTWDNLKQWATGALAAFSVVHILEGIINFTRESITMAAKVTDAFGGIQKTTGMTNEEVRGLNSEIAKIDTRTAQDSLLGIAQVGGQIGVVKDEMLGFVESVDKAVVALGDEFSGGAEEVASKMGILKNLFQETKDLEAGDAINRIGSAINELGSAGTATGPVVAEFATRIGQLGNLAPQISQTLGLGAAFQELGLTAEIASSGLSNILLTAASRTADFADHLGMTEQKFKDLVNSDPNEVILQLAASFKGVPVDQVVKSLADLGVKSQEATKVMSLLSDQTDIVRDKQDLANTAMQEATSLTDEFNVMNNTAQAQLEKKQKAIDELKVSLGMSLLPALMTVTTAAIAFVRGIQAIPEFIRENRVMIAALGTAIVALNWPLVSATANTLLLTAAKKGMVIWTTSSTTALHLLKAAMTTNPIGIWVAAIALLVGGLVTAYQKSETFRGAVNGVWEAIKTGVSVVIEIAENIWKGFQQLIDKLPLFFPAFLIIREAAKIAFELVGQIIDWAGTKISSLGDWFSDLGDRIAAIGQSIGAALRPGIEVVTDGFETARAAVASFINMLQAGISKVAGFLESITPSGFTNAFKVFTDAGSRISKSFNDAFSSEQSKGHAQQSAADKAHNEGKTAGAKQTAEQIAANATATETKQRSEKAAGEETARQGKLAAEGAAKNKELDDKAKKNAAHRDKEAEKAKKAAEKEAAEKVKAEADALRAVEDAKIKAIQDDETREVAKLQLSYQREVERIGQSKAAQSIKAAWEIALYEQLERDVDKVQADFRTKKIEDEKKRVEEINKLEAQQRADRQSAEYTIQKTILETQLANERLSVAERQVLKLQLIDLEHQADLARIEDVAAKERAKAQETSDQLIKLAGDDAERKKQIENETAATLRQIDDNRIAQTNAANTQHQQDLQAVEKANLEQRRANQQGYFDALSSLMRGDYDGFMNILNQKLANEEAANNQNLQNFTQTGQDILGVAKAGVEALMKLSEARLKKELANIDEEKKTQLESWEDKYEKGLLSKEDYEAGVEKINKDAALKEHQSKLNAWKREQKMQIGMALINAAMAALKSLATMGFPLGLIGVAASAVLAGVQIGIIKSQQPPSMAKGGYIRNAGVPEGPRHGARYGDSGISMVRRDTGEEVGEMEGGEPVMILSRNTYKNNRRTIDALLDSSLHRNGAPIYAEKGSVFGSDGGSYRDYLEPLKKGQSYLFGTKKKKREAEEAARQAEADAAKMQAEMDAELAAAQAQADAGSNTGGQDPYAYYGEVPNEGDASAATAATNSEIGRSQKLMEEIADNTSATVDVILELKNTMNSMGAKLDSISGAANRGADGAWAAASASNRAADAVAMSGRNDL